MQQMETDTGRVHNDAHQADYMTNGTSPNPNMSDAEDEQNENPDEMEDDPGKLLNEWLGELNTLKQVGLSFNSYMTITQLVEIASYLDIALW